MSTQQCRALTQKRTQCQRSITDSEGSICGIHKKIKIEGGHLEVVPVPISGGPKDGKKTQEAKMNVTPKDFLEFITQMEIITLKEQLIRQQSEISMLRLRLNVAHKTIHDLIKKM